MALLRVTGSTVRHRRTQGILGVHGPPAPTDDLLVDQVPCTDGTDTGESQVVTGKTTTQQEAKAMDRPEKAINRREFLTSGEKATLGLAGAVYFAGAAQQPAQAKAEAEAPYRFKIGMYLNELGLPFDESLATAKDIGAEYVWVNRIQHGETEVHEMNDADADRLAQRVDRHGLKLFLLNAGNPFKAIHLTDLKVDGLEDNELFKHDLHRLVRAMKVAARIGVDTVGAFTFAWPGEYKARKPTWPMRWLTRGGFIADIDMQKLKKAFTIVAEEADRHNIDVALSQMPWNYTNTTGNFRRIVEEVGSRRLKVMWGPSDNYNSGEWDVATAGFQNVRPYLHGLHLKDLRVNNGLKLDFTYCPIGEGHVDYLTVLRNVRDHRCDAVLSLSTHFMSDQRLEAMRINYRNLTELIRKVEAEA